MHKTRNLWPWAGLWNVQRGYFILPRFLILADRQTFRMKLFSSLTPPKMATLLATVLLGLAGSIPVLQAQEVSSQSLGNDLTLISGTGTNILVKELADGSALVVDGGLEQYASRTLAAINEATGDANISLLVNTHWHPEQTGLNRVLAERGVTIFAHENTRQWLTTDITRPWENRRFEPLPVSAQPGETFFHYGTMDAGGTEVLYGYLRQAHTDGDMYIYLPEDNILHAGGVIANDGWPLVDWWTGGWIGGLVNGLEVLLEIANDDTIIIPASGAVMSKAELQAMRDMYNTIFQRISEGFRAANSVEDTLEQAPTAEFNAIYGDPESFVRRSHESLVPHYTPDA